MYEMMEADTRKYSQYEEALMTAMTDLVKEAEHLYHAKYGKSMPELDVRTLESAEE